MSAMVLLVMNRNYQDARKGCMEKELSSNIQCFGVPIRLP